MIYLKRSDRIEIISILETIRTNEKEFAIHQKLKTILWVKN